LSGTNTYTGGTNVNGPVGSTLKAGNNAALGASTNNLSIAAGNNFDINNFTVNVGGLSGTGNVTNTGGGGSITAGNGNASSTFDGVITQASSANPLTLGKVGTGTLTLNGNNSYTGSTVVFGGTLLVNGNQSSATGGVLIAGGAKLGGNGTVGGDVTIDAGQLSPGNSPGILTLTKDVKFQNGASFQVEIQGTVAGSGYDQLLLNSGTSNYVITGNSTLVGTRLGGFNVPNFTAFEIIKNPNGPLGSGTFAGLPDGSFFDFDGQQMQIRYNVPNNYFLSPTGGGITWAGDDGFGNYGADNGGSIVIAAVPEPTTWAMILITVGLGGYVGYRRYRLNQLQSDWVVE
jgi:autotransporter-associated beta strand protein